MILLAFTCETMGRIVEAEELFRQAFVTMCSREPRPSGEVIQQAAGDLRRILRAQGKTDESVRVGRELLDFLIGAASGPAATATDMNQAAWSLLFIDEPVLKDPHRALEFATLAVGMSGESDASMMITLALAHHLTGDHTRAVEVQERAIAMLPPDAPLRSRYEGWLGEFKAAARRAR
jgi:hypothetical protein